VWGLIVFQIGVCVCGCVGPMYLWDICVGSDWFQIGVCVAVWDRCICGISVWGLIVFQIGVCVAVWDRCICGISVWDLIVFRLV